VYVLLSQCHGLNFYGDKKGKRVGLDLRVTKMFEGNLNEKKGKKNGRKSKTKKN
jgi:hypothetical protein